MFTGSMVALVTPFKNGSIDEDALRRLVDHQIQNGTQVLVPCGTTGESATLSHEEHDRVIAIVVEHAARRVRVLAGAGSNATDEAVRLHKVCKSVGADGALHITPYYNKPTQAGLAKHFETIAASADVPVVLYNVPGRTGVNMLPETVSRLAKVDTIVGIKEASGSLDQVSKIIQQVDENFTVLSGEDSLTFPMYALGAKGAISVTCHVQPRLCADQWIAVQKNDWQLARQIHFQLLDLHYTLFVETNPIPVKAALAMMGLIREEYRLPLVPLADDNNNRLRAVMQKAGLV